MIKQQQEFTFSDSVCIHKNYSRFFPTIQNKHANCQLAGHQLFSPLFIQLNLTTCISPVIVDNFNGSKLIPRNSFFKGIYFTV